MPLDFSKIWANSGDTSAPSDPQYSQGFSFLGAAPPTVELFNFLFQNIDQKLLSLFNISRQWQPGIEYSVGDVIFTSAASYKYMECTVAGTSGTTEPTWPIVGNTITDNTVTWIVRSLQQGVDIGKLIRVVDTGSGIAGLPAISGALLTARGKGNVITITKGAQSIPHNTPTVITGLSVTIPRSGIYAIFSPLIWTALSGNCEIKMTMLKNGVASGDTANFVYISGTAPNPRINTIGSSYVTGDVISVQVNQTSGSALSLNNSGLYAYEIGGAL